MAQGTGFQGTYRVTPKPKNEVKPGHWYYGFDCLECGERFAVFDSKGPSAPVTFAGGGHIRTTCPHCAADRLYEPAQAVHFQGSELLEL